MTYNRVNFTDNIGYTSIIDEKFKTNVLRIKFITELDSNKTAQNSIAAGILATSNSKLKTLAKLNEKLSLLYGSSIHANVVKRGDTQILTIGASWLDNRYALENEDITAEVLDITLDCIFAPNAENGAFDAASLNIRKNDLIDKIEAEINNKRGYAISQACKTAFCGEPAACSSYGNHKDAEAVTAEAAYNAYKELIRNSQIEIFFVGPQENLAVEQKLEKAFKSIERDESRKYLFSSESPLKSEAAEVTEQMDVNQSKMVLAFKSKSTDSAAIKLLSTIYGETPFSKLFANVREKLSLCYYCASSYVKSKNTMLVDCGVEKDNIEKAKNEIINQLNEIKNGNFTDDDIKNSLLSLENALSGVGDVPSSYISWYFGRFCCGDSLSPQQVAEQYREVTKERIITAAKSFELDTVYVMLQKEDAN